MALARQIQVTRARPHGLGKVSEVSEEEFAANPDSFRWIADEEREAEAANAKAAEAQAQREAAQLLDARQYRVSVWRDRKHRIAAQVAESKEHLAKQQERHDELLRQLAEVGVGLQEAQAVVDGLAPAVVPPVPAAAPPPAPEPIRRRVTAADSQRVK